MGSGFIQHRGALSNPWPTQPGVVLLALEKPFVCRDIFPPISSFPSQLAVAQGPVSGNVGNTGNVSDGDQHWDT